MTDLLKGNTSKTLMSMSVPVSIGMLSTFLFQVIDTYFVGQLGPNALAALSFSSTVYFLMIGLFIGLSVGVSILVGKAFGEENFLSVKKVSITGLILGVLLTAALSGSIYFLVSDIFRAMGAPDDIIPLISEYLFPLLLGMPLLTFGLISGSIQRSVGNVSTPEIIMAIAGVINLIFDYLLIFGEGGFPKMGIAGAAWATFISWIFVAVGMLVLMLRKRLLTVNIEFLKGFIDEVRSIMTVGIPTIVTQMIGPITLTFLTFLLARESELAVAAFGVASRIETLLLIGILGVSTALTPFISQNLGAHHDDRIDQAIVFGGRASTILGFIVFILLVLLIEPIAGIFSEDQVVIDSTTKYFLIVGGPTCFTALIWLRPPYSMDFNYLLTP